MATIEPLTSADIPACVQIMLQNPLWQHYGISASGAEMMFTRALAESATILAAREGEQVVGFAWYALRGAWDRSAYIRLIGVLPVFQGKRIGEQLMAAVEASAARQVDDIFLLVTDFNTQAQRFYRRLGYQQVGAIPDYVMPGIAELIFHKRLDRKVTDEG